MYFPYINAEHEVNSGPLRLIPEGGGIRISTNEGDPDLLAPRARTLQGYLLLCAAAQHSKQLWQAALVMDKQAEHSSEGCPSVPLEEYRQLPAHWGWEKGGVALFDLSVTLPRLEDRGVSLYQAFLVLLRSSRDFQPLIRYAGEALTRKYLRWAEYQIMDVDTRDDAFADGPPEPITEEELQKLLQCWCELFQALCP